MLAAPALSSEILVVAREQKRWNMLQMVCAPHGSFAVLHINNRQVHENSWDSNFDVWLVFMYTDSDARVARGDFSTAGRPSPEHGSSEGPRHRKAFHYNTQVLPSPGPAAHTPRRGLYPEHVRTPRRTSDNASFETTKGPWTSTTVPTVPASELTPRGKRSKPHAAHGSMPQVCSDCDDIASHHCQDCSCFLCHECAAHHRKVKVSREHRLYSVEDHQMMFSSFASAATTASVDSPRAKHASQRADDASGCCTGAPRIRGTVISDSDGPPMCYELHASDELDASKYNATSVSALDM